MASSIDPLKPESGSATTASVRTNFATAANEITALQTADTAAAAALAAPSGSLLVGFIQSGTGAVATTVQAQLRKSTFLSDWSSEANYLVGLAALTDRLGVSRLHFQQNNGVRYQTSTGYGPFTSHTLQSTFSGTVDNVLMLGAYNILEGTSGTKIVSAEPTIFLSLEADYNNGSAHLMEMNIDYTSADGLVSGRRFYSMTVDRSSHVATFGWNADQIFFKDSTAVNQWFNAAVTSTTAVLSLGAGTTVSRTTNNVSWLTQLNAAGNASVELLRVDASNQVYIAPGAGLTITGGPIGIGGNANTSRGVTVSLGLVGTQQFCYTAGTTFTSACTTGGTGFQSGIGTENASFTCPDVTNFLSVNGTKGAASTITRMVGFRCDDLTSGTSNYAFWGRVASGANNYNLRCDGTAQNYLAGVTGVGATPSTTTNLNLGAGTTGVSSLRIPHGAAPSSPVNGDMWTDTSGAYIRINGVTKTFTLT